MKIPFISFLFLVALLPSIYVKPTGDISIRKKSKHLITSVGTVRDTVIDPLHPDYVNFPLQDWEKKFTNFEFETYFQNGHKLPYRFYRPKFYRNRQCMVRAKEDLITVISSSGSIQSNSGKNIHAIL